MECNKDEAKRAMDIAERKITEKDYNGAKKFVNKAQNLYPNLDGLKQLLTTVEVYISGERKLAGEADWYGILGVNHLATDVEVRRKYLRLALLLHPDKNSFKGAEGAFKLLSDAWVLLSDSDKRSSYNELIWKIYGTQSAATPPPFYRSEPVTVGESRPKPKPRGRPPKSRVDKTNATQPTTQSAANPPPPTPFCRYEPVILERSSNPCGREGDSSVDKTNATQPTANPQPPHDQPTPSYSFEPVTVKFKPTNPRDREGESSGVEEKEWVVKRRLVKRSDRRVRTTP